MDLKEKIKIALREDRDARKYIKWNPDSQPNLYQLDLFLRKSGYRLTDALKHDKSVEILLEPIKYDRFHPTITHQPAEKEFYIHVDKEGELTPSEVKNLIEGYQTAISVVKRLSALDLNKLEINNDEEVPNDEEGNNAGEDSTGK